MQRKRYFFYVALVMILLGCKEKYPVYSSFCENNGSSVLPCLHYAVYNQNDKTAIKEALGMEDTPECEYRVELTKYHVGDCNNPVVKSTGSDFDGYVRLEIKKGFTCYYKIQSDYKNDADAAFARVLKQSKKEIKLKKDTKK